MAFPEDLYTPHGYLDLPHHTRRLNPLGVLRSQGVGFLWHFPAYAGGYGGRRSHYAAGFQVSLGGAHKIADLDEVFCPYHSKNLFEFRLRKGRAVASAVFHPVGDHVLRCRLQVHGKGRAQVGIHAQYSRLLGASGEWGESGLVGRYEGGQVILQAFEGGEAFLLDCSIPPQQWSVVGDPAGAAPGGGQAGPEARQVVTAIGKPGETVSLIATLAFTFEPRGEAQTLEVILARGPTVPRARAELARARAQAGREEERRRASDAHFWGTAPRLEGDWPDHWRRGLVYDLETVRMMVKPPAGIYRYPWDAMQIHAPRVVLAESAMDALLLAYADPALAQQLLLGTFCDAPEPNVPCSREDGSYNMVSADGTACGTAPAWGYPWLVIAQLAALHPDRFWLEQLYPRLAEYLDWWLLHRRDPQGWLVYACSWESGQDGSPRFGELPLGEGSPTWYLRAADLQAAFAHAAGVMAGLAETLGRPKDQVKWTAIESEFRRRTDALWAGSRYADADARSGQLTAVGDVMLLAPAALGVAHTERIAALRPAIAALEADTLTWPMFAWTATEAALAAGLPDKAAELAGTVCERAYRLWDARTYDPERTLPGIAAEYWPTSGRCGGEGYGWGAFTTHLLMRALIGLGFHTTHLSLRPNLPPAWRRPGRRFGLRWHCRGQPLLITLQPLRGRRVRVSLNDAVQEVAWGEEVYYPWEALVGAEGA